MRRYMRILATPFAVLLLTYAMVEPSFAAPKPKVVVNKPSAPTITAISSTAPKKNKVNLTISISLPSSNGGSVITGSKVSAKGTSCTMTRTKKSCTVKNVKVGSSLNFTAQSKNKKGFGPASVAVTYVVNGASWSPPATVVVTPAPVEQAPAPVVITPTCTIVGTSGNESLIGTPGDDIICGMGGQDIIYGLGGNDKIYAVSLSSSVNSTTPTKGTGYPTGSTMYGGDGSDLLIGSSVNDVFIGESGSDTYQLNGGADLCRFDLSDIQISGCVGNRAEIAGSGISGIYDYNSSTASAEIVIKNVGNSWKSFEEFSIMKTFDGQDRDGGGGGQTWIGPGQTLHFVQDWNPLNDFSTNIDGEPGFPALLAWTLTENTPATAQRINPNISVTLGNTEWENANNMFVVPFTAVNNSAQSGTLHLVVQVKNGLGEVVMQGDAVTSSSSLAGGYLPVNIGANATVQGKIRFFSSSMILLREDFSICYLAIT